MQVCGVKMILAVSLCQKKSAALSHCYIVVTLLLRVGLLTNSVCLVAASLRCMLQHILDAYYILDAFPALVLQAPSTQCVRCCFECTGSWLLGDTKGRRVEVCCGVLSNVLR